MALLSVSVEEMEVISPPLIEVAKPAEESEYVPCSDHCGLRLGVSV